MASPAQILANQANAQSSTGPRTLEGKAGSSQNALRHGLTSAKFTLKSEEQDEYNLMRDGIFAGYHPANQSERDLCDLLAQAQWRLFRVRRTETLFLEQTIEDIQTENPQLDHDEALAFIFASSKHARQLSLFLRYQTSIERAWNKALTELEKAQKARRQREKEQAILEAWVEAPRENDLPAIGFVSQTGPQAQ
jgi:hypothetical protein